MAYRRSLKRRTKRFSRSRRRRGSAGRRRRGAKRAGFRM